MSGGRPHYSCPACDGRLRTRVRRLMYSCRSCGEVIVEVSSQERVVPTGDVVG